MREIPIGTDDFRTIRETGCLYVDKSGLIAEVLAHGRILLLPRPRRFGKTLNMTMLQAFFDHKQDSRALFEGLAITANAEAMTHLNAYPTIFLSLKGLKALDWAECCEGIVELVGETIERHYADLDLSKISPARRALFQAAYDQVAPVLKLRTSLKTLTELLYRSTGKKVVLLIDEYDTPIHSGHAEGFYSEIINFMRDFLGEALKGNPYLERAVVTGILRVGKESIYSGLNNLAVYTMLDEPFSTCFGFSESEVAQLLLETQSPHPLSEVQSWYNGYRFGQTTIYNPWSILKMLGLPSAALTAYWIGTSSNELISDLVKNRSAIKTDELETLLLGQSVKCFIQESVAMADIDAKSVWSLLLFSGYLTPDHYDPKTKIGQLRLPNLEVRSFFEANVTQWLGDPSRIFAITESLLALRLNKFADHLAESIKNILSYHDVGGPGQEKTYHVLMVGLLASLSDRYEVLSNRESGYGRYDLALLPSKPGLPGFIFEFKQAEPKSLAQTAELALAQIAERGYASTMYQRGVVKLASLGLAFSGKRVALACSVQDSNQPQSSGTQHYLVGDEEDRNLQQLPKAKELKPARKAAKKQNKKEAQIDKPSLATQVQFLQHQHGLPVATLDLLLSLEQEALEKMLVTLRAGQSADGSTQRK